MFQNYFKVALRSLRKQKTYSMIMIGGFSIGVEKNDRFCYSCSISDI